MELHIEKNPQSSILTDDISHTKHLLSSELHKIVFSTEGFWIQMSQ